MQNQSISYLIYCIVENEGFIPYLANDLDEIAYKDIIAVVRKVDAKSIEELSLDKELLKNCIVAYQQANIDIFNHYTILPIRFGTMVDSEEEIEDFLASNYIHIKWAFDRLKGKAEITVHLSWDLEAVLQEINQDKQWLDNAKQSIDLTNTAEIGRLLFVTADTKKKEIVDSVHSKLIAVSLDSSDGRCSNEQIIMNRSYLIEKTAENIFDEAMTELAEENKSYLSLKYIGPLPPYSFAPVEFKRGNFELINEARRKLLLPEQASFREIKASYRRLSLKFHPDNNPGDPQSSERFREINEAYQILETYVTTVRGVHHPRKSKEYSFTQDDVESVFIANRKMVTV